MSKLTQTDILYNTQLLVQASQKGDVETVKRLLPISIPKSNDNSAFRIAATFGHLEIVKLLLPVSNPKANDSEALRQASYNGYTEIVKLLIPVSDPQAEDNFSLFWAARKGYFDIVKLLIPVSDPQAADSLALEWAATFGHANIVEALIPVSNPNDYDKALLCAAENECIECIKLLLPYSNYNLVLTTPVLLHSERQLLQHCIDVYEAVQQQKRLETSIEPCLQHASHHTKRKM